MKKKKGIWIALALLLAAGAVTATFIATKNHYENRKTVEVVEVEKEKLIEVPVETKVEITAEIIKEGLSDIGELATEEYSYTEVGTYDSAKTVKGFNIPLTKSRFIYSYDGTIKAGIDFTAVEVEKDDADMRITVTLPPARILSSSLDEDSFQLYDEKNSIFNPFSVSDVNATNRELKTNAEDKAVARGLLDRANENAGALILGFLQSGYDLGEYKIEVRQK